VNCNGSVVSAVMKTGGVAVIYNGSMVSAVVKTGMYSVIP